MSNAFLKSEKAKWIEVNGDVIDVDSIIRVSKIHEWDEEIWFYIEYKGGSIRLNFNCECSAKKERDRILEAIGWEK